MSLFVSRITITITVFLFMFRVFHVPYTPAVDASEPAVIRSTELADNTTRHHVTTVQQIHFLSQSQSQSQSHYVKFQFLSLRHYATTPLRHYATTPLRNYATTPLRHYATTPLRHYATTRQAANLITGRLTLYCNQL